MQIQTATKDELGLLIKGLRQIYVDDVEHVRHSLLVQLENELLTRFGLRIGEPDEQERVRQPDPS